MVHLAARAGPGEHGVIDKSRSVPWVVTPRAVRVLRAVAVAGPVVFTLDWLLLGWAHRGYRPRVETISSLSAHDASGWPVMVVGQLALAVGFVAVAVLAVAALGRRGWPTATLLALTTLGAVQLSAFRTVCTQSDASWCTPLPRSAYPDQQWLHGIGTGIAFTCLVLACLACAWATWSVRPLRDLAVASVATAVVAVPSVFWFLSNASDPVDQSWHGFAEKIFFSALATWTAFAGVRLASVATRAPAPTPVAQRG
jgi:hypothetical protein